MVITIFASRAAAKYENIAANDPKETDRAAKITASAMPNLPWLAAPVIINTTAEIRSRAETGYLSKTRPSIKIDVTPAIIIDRLIFRFLTSIVERIKNVIAVTA